MANSSVPSVTAGPQLQLQYTLEGHSDRVWHASWHPTRELLATCSGDRTVRVWQRRKHSSAVVEGDATPHTKDTWRCVGVLDDFTTRTVRCCEWSPDGRLLACTSFDGKAYVWALSDQHAAFNEETSGLQQAEISMDLLATLEGHENEVKGCAWSPSGSLLATCGRDKSVWLWGLDEEDADLEVVSVLHGHSQDVKSVKWHPNRDMLFSASYDDTIKVWGEASSDWVCVDTLTAHSSTVWDLAFFDDGIGFASVSDDLSLCLWTGAPTLSHQNPYHIVDLMTFKKAASLKDLHSRTIFTVSCTGSDDSDLKAPRLIATGAADDSIHIVRCEVAASDDSASHDPASSSLLGVPTPATVAEDICAMPHAHTADVNCVRWNPRRPGELVSCGDDGVAKIWSFKF